MVVGGLALLAGIAVLGLLFVWHAVGASGSALPLRVVTSTPLSGNTGRLDYESLDETRGLLFIAHLGDNSVIAFDTKRDRIAATIPGTDSVRGVLVVPSLHRVFAAAAGSHEVVVIDEGTNKVVARVTAGDVDGLAYDPQTHQLFVSDEGGSTDAVIDVRTNQLRTHIALGGEAGNTQYDDRSHHIFVAVQTRDELAEIDPRTLTVVRRYPLPGCLHGHGLQLDSAHRYAYIACQVNSAVVRLNLRTGKVDANSSVGFGPDVLAMDYGLARLYVAAESGIVTVFDTKAGSFRKVGQAVFAPNAHVVGVDQRSHRVYFPLRDVGGKPVLRVAVPGPSHG